MGNSDPVLTVKDLSKSYGSNLVLDDVTFSVLREELVCMVGPSGAGKTTLLRCIAQLTERSSGVVRLHGRELWKPPREMAVVFQDFSRSLMPWMRVGQNIALPIRRSGLTDSERKSRIEEVLEAVGLSGYLEYYPWELSGGMQQRVAIARALAYDPEILVMDEPFASVDAQTRAELEDLVVKLRNDIGVTVLLVTHDIDEAVYMADKVVVLSGSPARVTETVSVDLGRERDQISTKAAPAFVEKRSVVAKLIMGSKKQ